MRKCVLPLAFALLAFPGVAAAQFDLDQLIRLQESGAAAEAYAYASQFVAEQEGDPVFDYYYGIAAIDSGNSSHGVFALERVLAFDPSNHAARLELARGYFVLEEYARSRAEFEIVLAADPPPAVRANIDRFLNAIRMNEGRYRTTANAFAEFGLGADSNINSGPEDAQLSSGFVLDASAVETSDTYSALTAGAQMDVPLAPGRRAFAAGSADLRAHAQESQFDNYTIDARAGMVFLRQQNRLQTDLQVQTYSFDSTTFRDLAALNAEWRQRAGERSQYSLFGQYASLSYPDQAIRDSSLITLGVGYTRQIGGRLAPAWFASVFAGAEDPDSAGVDAARVAERSLYGGRAGLQLTTGERSTLRATLSLQGSRYAEADATLGERREDNYASLGAEWAWLINRRWSVRARANYANNESNIDLNTFRRSFADVRIRLDFD